MIRSLILAVALLANTAGAFTPNRDEAQILAQGDLWNAAYEAGDWPRLRGLYTDDAWLMSDKAPAAKGADAIVAYLRRNRDMGATVTFRFTPEDVKVQKPYGFLVATYQMTAQLPGKPAIRTAGRSLLIYRWQGGRWKLWRDMDNTSPDVAVEK